MDDNLDSVFQTRNRSVALAKCTQQGGMLANVATHLKIESCGKKVDAMWTVRYHKVFPMYGGFGGFANGDTTEVTNVLCQSKYSELCAEKRMHKCVIFESPFWY